jgi:hypothetical protein
MGYFSPDATARSTIILILSSLISRSDADGGGRSSMTSMRTISV